MEYRRVSEIGRGSGAFEDMVRAAALDSDGTWYLAGGKTIQAFAGDGTRTGSWVTAQPVWSLGVDSSGHVWAGEPGQIEVFVADAGSRWIHRFDRERRLLNHIGDRHRKGGFHIPNGVVDFGVDLDGTLVVANPGMHRVERYKPDGEPLGHFGQFGQQDPAGFPGCCNPTNLALGRDGEIVVSEKAGPRVKVYDPRGQLIAVVAGGNDFAPECKNMDLVVTREGLIGVVDPIARMVVLFEVIS